MNFTKTRNATLRISFLLTIMLLTTKSFAGGLMTNTNYHIAFDRMMARGASFGIDAAYSNPAGLAWGYEGFQMSLDFQKPWQYRNIATTIPNFMGSDFKKKYEGKASAPIVPAIFAAYKKDRINVSAMIGIVGSGGAVEYGDGVPMFNIPVIAILAQKGIMPGSYTLDSNLKGKQYIYGGQVNFGYKITDYLSAAIGMRANYYDGYYRGNVTASVPQMNLVNLQLNCIQKGWGFAPIVSVNFHKGPLTIAAKYEFRTKLETENDTKTLNIDIAGMSAAQASALMENKVAGYIDGAKTRYDMPALLAVAVGYEFSDKFRATAEYHFFDDKNAKAADNRQKKLTGGTKELQLGMEYDINKKFTVSVGGQRTDYGLSDDYQQNTSFACDSYSVGAGVAYNVNRRIRINAGYFTTLYSDYTKNIKAGDTGYYGTKLAATEVYSRTNNVIGIGIDYKF